MKTRHEKGRHEKAQEGTKNETRCFGLRIRNTQYAIRNTRAFTLIELLVVMAVISLLAAMIIPITGAVNRNKLRARARAEVFQLVTAIETYKTQLGHYPPDNPGSVAPINQLYFELLGTVVTNVNGVQSFQTLDQSADIPVAEVANRFGAAVAGFVNCSRGAGDENRRATAFLKALKPGQYADVPSANTKPVRILTTTVPAPPPYPFGDAMINPIRYNSSSPTNNPNSYDLWVDIVVAGKTNRICNWSREPLINPGN